MGKFIDKINADKVINTVLGCSPKDVASTVILSCTDRIKEYMSFCEKIIEFKGWWRGFTGIFDGCKTTVIHSGMGCSSVGDLTMFLSRSSGRIIIYTGLIGGITSNIKPGNLIVPTKAVIGEGFSHFYVSSNFTPRADLKLLKASKPLFNKFANKLNLSIHFGTVYTIESLVAETNELIDQLSKDGIIGIDMETSAFFVAATIARLRPLAIHFVSDSPPFSSFDRERGFPLYYAERVWKSVPNLILSLAANLSRV